MSLRECDLLDDYLLAGLAEGEAAGFEAHLAGCPACREEVREQRRIDRLLAEGVEEVAAVPASLLDRIEAAFRRSHRRRVARWAFGLSGTLAASVLAVWLAMGAFSTGNHSQPMVREYPGPPGDAQQPNRAGPTVPRPAPVATVTFDDPSAAILVPLKSGQPNISIVWVYPTVTALRAPTTPGND